MINASVRLFSLISICALLITMPLQNTLAQEVVASYQTFYDQLAPYGQWVTDPQYGDVWVPNAAPGFRPYATNGHWAMTEYGNTWVSDDPYGWAVYHYGRWTYNPYYGWVWIPGSEWAPAWVSWRYGDGFYGWAPMGPGYEAGGSYAYPDNYWVFVGPENLYRPDVYSYYDYSRNYYYIQHTAYMHEMYEGNGMRYNYGPRPEMIERETHQPVQVYRISNAGEMGGSRVSGNTVRIYRPSINPASERTSRPANAIRASQPIGRPQEISRGSEQPAFRQEIQRQTPQTRFQNNNANYGQHGQNMNSQPTNGAQRQQHFQPNNQPTGNQQYNSRGQQYNNQQPRQQQEPGQQQNRQRGGNNQQQMNRQQQAGRPQPQKEPSREPSSPREPNRK